MNPHDELKSLVELFPSVSPLIERAEHLPSAMTPEPYKSLLAHDHHMTVAMESFHKSSVEVRVLAKRLDGNVYCRKIVLLKQGIDRFDVFWFRGRRCHLSGAEISNRSTAGRPSQKMVANRPKV